MKYMENLKMNSMQALIEHVLNKFAPYLLVGIILYMNFELTNIGLYVIMGSIIFIDRYSGFVGRCMSNYDNDSSFKKRVDDSLNEK